MLKSKSLQNKILIILSLLLLGAVVKAQSFKTITSLGTISSTTKTADKPQSKVWFYGGYWWTVAPVTGGTYIYRLDGTSWTQLSKIFSSTLVKADVKLSNDTAYVLLCSSSIPPLQKATLLRAKYIAGSPPTYSFSLPADTTQIPIDSYSETSTIDIDSKWIMWLASDGGGTSASSGLKKINVRWSSYPYTTWSDSITLETGVNWDDICAITAYDPDGPSKIGIMWSNQSTTSFRFAYHIDGDNVNSWTTETIISVPSPGYGVADDHINLKVGSDGTIYAAVKTGYDTPEYPQIGLLVKSHDGTWSSLYTVTKNNDNGPGTRPIALLNEVENKITVIYTQKELGSDIVYKESSTGSINFPDRQQYLRFGTTDYDNVSSTKQNYTDSVVIIFSTGTVQAGGPGTWNGVIAKRSSVSTTNGAGYALSFDGSDDFLRMDNNSTINLTSSLTVEAWIDPTSLKNCSILNKTSSSSNGYELAITSAGKVTFRINGTTLTSNQSYLAGTWTHIAVTFNSSSGDMKIYINGVLDINSTTSSSLSSNIQKLKIAGDTNFFNGSLDEIRLWNTARTETQIQANMCKKLSGSESGLVAYWNFDSPEGLNVPDKTSNNNYITMHDMANYVYDWSGAAIGDESAYDYDASGGFTQNLTHSDGDDITATTTGGTVTGLQIYRVDSNPLRSGSSNTADTLTTIDPLRYWGVKAFGTSPTYTLTYNYDGHPGITSETGLGLLFRDNLSDDTWGELYASLNTSANTLTKSGLTGTEFVLASSNAPLPVELTTFSARILDKKILLNWETSTEVQNYGFDVEKSSDGKIFSKLGFVQGSGNSNSTKYYSFEDNSPNIGTIYYRLKQIDTDGSFNYSKIISVNLNIPAEFNLSQNYPNPFNPTTTIDFTLPSSSYVSLKVYDLLGNQTASLINEQKEAGSYSLLFDGTNLASGNYIYVINGGGKVISKKMTLLK